MRIGMVTGRGSHSPKTWSGTPFYMARSLEAAGAQINHIGPIIRPLDRNLQRLMRLQAYATGLKVDYNRSALASFRLARSISRKMRETAPNVLLAPAGSQIVANLDITTPLIYTSDATVALMRDYYPEFKALPQKDYDRAHLMEAKAIARADMLIYPTQWAAQSAIEDYGADPALIQILPYGANLDGAPKREAVLHPKGPGMVKILFNGVDWDRKGGDIVLQTMAELERRGVTAELTILGMTPPARAKPLPDRVTIIPFLNKNDPGERARFEAIMAESDLLLLPTQAECYGIVFCEASAYGIPSIARATGGAAEVVRDGVNGFSLPETAPAAAYADKIEMLINAPEKLTALQQSARRDYETRLNWEIWAKRVLDLTRKKLVPGEIA